MRINSTHKNTFGNGAQLVVTPQKYASSKNLRPLIIQLKQHSGSKKVQHSITIDEKTGSFKLLSKCNFPNKAGKPQDYERSLELTSASVSKQNVAKMIEWTMETKNWVRRAKKGTALDFLHSIIDVKEPMWKKLIAKVQFPW